MWIQGERPEDVAIDEKVTARPIRRYEQHAWPKGVGYINRRSPETVDEEIQSSGRRGDRAAPSRR